LLISLQPSDREENLIEDSDKPIGLEVAGEFLGPLEGAHTKGSCEDARAEFTVAEDEWEESLESWDGGCEPDDSGSVATLSVKDHSRTLDHGEKW
jgi:hypothetical protein